MAEDVTQSRTEAPTQRRREEARQQGQVAVSAELSHGMLLLVGSLALWCWGHVLAGGLMASMHWNLPALRYAEPGAGEVLAILSSMAGRGTELVGLFLGAMFTVGLLVSVLQVGVHVSPELVLPRWERLSPAQGWSRVLSAASGMRGVAAVLKMSFMALLVGWVLYGRSDEIAQLGEQELSQSAAQAWGIAMRLAVAIAAALVLIGVADYTYQRWRHERSLMMTRQDLKEELRREEGDPIMRARMRKLGRELARRRMMEDVPRASVVITNPTHLAIALRYERGTMPAPRVVAKGAGALARRIVELARRHAVPVVERKPVAQALYRAVKVGQDIPEALYYAVAEVLAYVYRLRGA